MLSTLAVTSSADIATDHHTLRYAVAHAESGDTILLTGAVHRTGITLTQGELLLTQQGLTIKAVGNTRVTISGNYTSRVFEVAPGAQVTLSNLVITGGNGLANNPAGDASKNFSGGGILVDAGAALTVSGSILSDNYRLFAGGISSLAAGAGIANYGTLTVSGSTLSGNYASSGGGISNYATLTVRASTLSDNHAFRGGGIYNEWNASYHGTVTVDSGSSLSGNVASVFGGFGGGIFNRGTVTVSDSTLSGNSAGNDGGGIYNISQRSPGTVTVSGSILSDNSAGRFGGGIANISATVTVDSGSNLSRNTAGNNGGGIYNAGTMTVSGSTLSDNFAGSDGGGIYTFSELTVSGSTLSGNTARVRGGGIFNSGLLTVRDASTICGNFAPIGFDNDVYNLEELYLSLDSEICALDNLGYLYPI